MAQKGRRKVQWYADMPLLPTKDVDRDATEKGSRVHIWQRRQMCVPLGFVLRGPCLASGLGCVSHVLGLMPRFALFSRVLTVWCQSASSCMCLLPYLVARCHTTRV